MPAVKIDAAWMAWRNKATRRQSTMLRKLAMVSAAAAHDYRMGETPVGYTAERNALVLRCLANGVPEKVCAVAANLSAAKISDIKRERPKPVERATVAA